MEVVISAVGALFFQWHEWHKIPSERMQKNMFAAAHGALRMKANSNSSHYIKIRSSSTFDAFKNSRKTRFEQVCVTNFYFIIKTVIIQIILK